MSMDKVNPASPRSPAAFSGEQSPSKQVRQGGALLSDEEECEWEKATMQKDTDDLNRDAAAIEAENKANSQAKERRCPCCPF